MCKIIDDYIKMGEDRGFKIGEEHGKELGAAETNERIAIDMLKDNEPLAKIKKYSKLSEASIRKLAKSLGVAVL